MQQQEGGGSAANSAPPLAFALNSAESAPSPITAVRQPPPPSEDAGGGGAGSFLDDAELDSIAGDRAGGSSGGGNRWPRQETLALLKIRSDMDAAFRDATPKAPLWEEVSRKLGELGYRRNGKKCKEKFENVHKYYKRTKESRAGRSDGKVYKFFAELEALHSSGPFAAMPEPSAAAAPVTPVRPSVVATPTTAAATRVVGVGVEAATPKPAPSSDLGPMTRDSSIRPPATSYTMAGPSLGVLGMQPATVPYAVPPGLSSCSNSDDDSEDEDSSEEDDDDVGLEVGGKRKRRGKLMEFMERMVKRVAERQEAMQRQFLEAVEKQQERLRREEAQRQQEMARLAREQEALLQERAMAASRDAAIISFIQKITGQTIHLPTVAAPPVAAAAPPAAATPPPPPPPKESPLKHRSTVIQPQPPAPSPPPHAQAQQQPRSLEFVPVFEPPAANAGTEGGGAAASSSRWPKAEVHALIQLRSSLDMRYQDTGPKGPLWEEISAGMRRLGYNRSSKRCKEKWENINKYFKKVKESNRQRPEDSKTCPYFHQLDALYRSKAQLAPAAAAAVTKPSLQPLLQEAPSSQAPTPTSSSKDKNDGQENGGHGGVKGETKTGTTTATTNTSTTDAAATTTTVKACNAGEGAVMDATQIMPARAQAAGTTDSDVMEADMDDSDSDTDDDDDDDDDVGGYNGAKAQYEILFQKQASGAGEGSGAPRPAAAGKDSGTQGRWW